MRMRIESSGHSRGNPRLYELVEHAPKTGKSPTVWAWPELMDYLKIAGQPVPGPWPPHQEPRPDPEEDSQPVAVADPGPAAAGARPASAGAGPASAGAGPASAEAGPASAEAGPASADAGPASAHGDEPSPGDQG
jgi:hypothetical protein